MSLAEEYTQFEESGDYFDGEENNADIITMKNVKRFHSCFLCLCV